MLFLLVVGTLVALKLCGVIAMSWLGMALVAFTALIIGPLILFVVASASAAALVAPVAFMGLAANRNRF